MFLKVLILFGLLSMSIFSSEIPKEWETLNLKNKFTEIIQKRNIDRDKKISSPREFEGLDENGKSDEFMSQILDGKLKRDKEFIEFSQSVASKIKIVLEKEEKKTCKEHALNGLDFVDKLSLSKGLIILDFEKRQKNKNLSLETLLRLNKIQNLYYKCNSEFISTIGYFSISNELKKYLEKYNLMNSEKFQFHSTANLKNGLKKILIYDFYEKIDRINMFNNTFSQKLTGIIKVPENIVKILEKVEKNNIKKFFDYNETVHWVIEKTKALIYFLEGKNKRSCLDTVNDKLFSFPKKTDQDQIKKEIYSIVTYLENNDRENLMDLLEKNPNLFGQQIFSMTSSLKVYCLHLGNIKKLLSTY